MIDLTDEEPSNDLPSLKNDEQLTADLFSMKNYAGPSEMESQDFEEEPDFQDGMIRFYRIRSFQIKP